MIQMNTADLYTNDLVRSGKAFRLRCNVQLVQFEFSIKNSETVTQLLFILFDFIGTSN